MPAAEQERNSLGPSGGTPDTALVLRAFLRNPDVTMMSCQAPGFVQWAVANPARSGREQR
jgi:hypothetical protein